MSGLQLTPDNERSKKVTTEAQSLLGALATVTGVFFCATLRLFLNYAPLPYSGILFYSPTIVILLCASFLWVPTLGRAIVGSNMFEDTFAREKGADIPWITEVGYRVMRFTRTWMYNKWCKNTALFLEAFAMVAQFCLFTILDEGAGGLLSPFFPVALAVGTMAVVLADKKRWGVLVLMVDLSILILLAWLRRPASENSDSAFSGIMSKITVGDYVVTIATTLMSVAIGLVSGYRGRVINSISIAYSKAHE